MICIKTCIKKFIGSLFWLNTVIFLSIRATRSSKSRQNAQSKCKNWGPSTEIFGKIIALIKLLWLQILYKKNQFCRLKKISIFLNKFSNIISNLKINYISVLQLKSLPHTCGTMALVHYVHSRISFRSHFKFVIFDKFFNYHMLFKGDLISEGIL